MTGVTPLHRCLSPRFLLHAALPVECSDENIFVLIMSFLSGAALFFSFLFFTFFVC